MCLYVYVFYFNVMNGSLCMHVYSNASIASTASTSPITDERKSGRVSQEQLPFCDNRAEHCHHAICVNSNYIARNETAIIAINVATPRHTTPHHTTFTYYKLFH